MPFLLLQYLTALLVDSTLPQQGNEQIHYGMWRSHMRKTARNVKLYCLTGLMTREILPPENCERTHPTIILMTRYFRKPVAPVEVCRKGDEYV